MLTHVLWCNVIRVNCPSNTTTHAFTGSWRVLLSIFVPMSKIDSWVWWRECSFQKLIQEVCRIPNCSCSQEGLPWLTDVSVFSGSHINARFTFAKQRSQCVRLIRKIQVFNGQSGFSEILIHVVVNFLESFRKWFADCSHCTQERPLPIKKNCLVSNGMGSPATNSSCRSHVLLVLSIVVSAALDHCQLLLLVW